MNRPITVGLCALTLLLTVGVTATRAVSLTIVNNCNQTLWPGISPAIYQNGGWSMSPHTSVTFDMGTKFNGRIWARTDCNTSTSPYRCDTGQCGGTGAQCAGTTGQPNTSLAEFNTNAGGTTDWYDVSHVDSYDVPIGLSTSSGLGYKPTATRDVLSDCPASLRILNASGKAVACRAPCGVFKSALVCCTGLSPQQCRDTVNQWPPDAQQYVSAVHNDVGEDYTYAWDDWWGLHTVATGSNWTVTFCPNGVQPLSGGGLKTFPLAPTGISAKLVSGHVNISWNPVSGATSYKIFRSRNSGASNGSLSDVPLSSGLTGTSFSDFNVVAGTTYYYIVTALNATGFSAPSGQVSITTSASVAPLLPTGVGVVSGNGSATVYWNASAGATSYNVYRGLTAGGEGATPVKSGVTALQVVDTGLTNGKAYFYKVAAVDSAGTSPMSTEASATPSTAAGTGISINCGGTVAGVFTGDFDFVGGSASSTTHVIDTTLLASPIPPQVLLQTNRHGNFTYTIGGFPAGSPRTVTLYFEEQYWSATGSRIFDTSINGKPVLTNFDILAAAGAKFKAIPRKFSTTANASGQVVVQFVSVKDNAMVDGISVQ